MSLYGQEKDSATSGLARMNMILHDYPTAQTAAHFGCIDIGDSDPLAIAKADAIAVKHSGDANA